MTLFSSMGTADIDSEAALYAACTYKIIKSLPYKLKMKIRWRWPPHVTQGISSSLALFQVSQDFNVLTEPHSIISINFVGWFSYYSWAQKPCPRSLCEGPSAPASCPSYRDWWAPSLQVPALLASLLSNCSPISASTLSCIHNTKKLFTVSFPTFTAL